MLVAGAARRFGWAFTWPSRCYAALDTPQTGWDTQGWQLRPVSERDSLQPRPAEVTAFLTGQCRVPGGIPLARGATRDSQGDGSGVWESENPGAGIVCRELGGSGTGIGPGRSDPAEAPGPTPRAGSGRSSQLPAPSSQLPDPRSQIPDPRSQIPDPTRIQLFTPGSSAGAAGRRGSAGRSSRSRHPTPRTTSSRVGPSPRRSSAAGARPWGPRSGSRCRWAGTRSP